GGGEAWGVLVHRADFSQRGFPKPPQGSRHQPIPRLDRVVLAKRAVGLLLSAFPTQLPVTVLLGPLGFDLLGGGQAQFEAGGFQSGQNLLGHQTLDLRAGQAHTGSVAVIQRRASTLVTQSRRVVRLHAGTAAATEHTSGEQRHARPQRRRFRAVPPGRRQTLDVSLKLLPVQVRGMIVGEKEGTLLRQPFAASRAAMSGASTLRVDRTASPSVGSG